ncbi:uncharacterized protein LOC143062109 isoform X1 [Mytilus galloprovincialis]|uniref:uncharacterized protein LOC143062109 isoform X1 n=1 Tax=Mytilus galloprovincialis TaxID=29158 RepID=UPI003F7C5F5D
MTQYTNGKMKCIIAIVIITAYYPNILSLTVTSTSQLQEVSSGSFATIVVTIDPNTDGVTGNWTMSDMSGGSKKIVIDNAKYRETLNPNSIELFIFDVKTSDIGFYIYHATDGLNFAKNTPLTLAITGSPPKVSTSMSMETVDIGQTLTLNCSYMIYDPNSILHVKWEKNSTSGELSYIDTSDTSKYDGSVATNPSLTIKNIDINDLGGYWCEVKNSDGTGKSPYITVQLPQGGSFITQAEMTTATSIHGSTSTVTEKGTKSTVTEKGTTSTIEKGTTSTVTEKVTTMTDKGEEMCPCNCDYKAKLDYWATQNVTNYTFEELKIILKPELDKLEKELRIDKHNLSAVIRKLTSAHDKRPSARHLGSFGIVFLIVLCLLIFASDLISIKQHIITIKRIWNIKVKR